MLLLPYLKEGVSEAWILMKTFKERTDELIEQSICNGVGAYDALSLTLQQIQYEVQVLGLEYRY